MNIKDLINIIQYTHKIYAIISYDNILDEEYVIKEINYEAISIITPENEIIGNNELIQLPIKSIKIIKLRRIDLLIEKLFKASKSNFYGQGEKNMIDTYIDNLKNQDNYIIKMDE